MGPFELHVGQFFLNLAAVWVSLFLLHWLVSYGSTAAEKQEYLLNSAPKYEQCTHSTYESFYLDRRLAQHNMCLYRLVFVSVSQIISTQWLKIIIPPFEILYSISTFKQRCLETGTKKKTKLTATALQSTSVAPENTNLFISDPSVVCTFIFSALDFTPSPHSR